MTFNVKNEELLEILARGEDSQHQLKKDFTNSDSAASELVAFANSGGGLLIIGVDKNRLITGLNGDDISRLNALFFNAASQYVKPPLNPLSCNVSTPNGLVMVVKVENGLNKPYTDLQGRIWVKSVGDKRHVTAREEIQRMFQQSGLVYADEVLLNKLFIEDIDSNSFSEYFYKRYRQMPEETGLSLARLLQNLNLAKQEHPNLTGALLFGRHLEKYLPVFMVKAVAFPGCDLHATRYVDSEDIDGQLVRQYQHSMSFIKRNLHHIQGSKSVNSVGDLEIAENAIEEILVNAFVHRDYFINAPIKIFVFADRVEIISPGHLPNHLTLDHIRYGLSNMRNPCLASHVAHMLPYRGLGSGIPRALHAWPKIDFVDDRTGNQFKVTLHRPELTK